MDDHQGARLLIFCRSPGQAKVYCRNERAHLGVLHLVFMKAWLNPAHFSKD